MVLDDFQGLRGFCYFCGPFHIQAEDRHSSSQRITSKDSIMQIDLLPSVMETNETAFPLLTIAL